jgi:hypothetical protein
MAPLQDRPHRRRGDQRHRSRYDDATAFIERELLAVRKKVYEVQYTELWA